MTTAPVATPAPTLPASPSTAAPETVGRDVTWPAVGAIWKREVKRFFRQRNRVIGAVATPVVFWLLLGLGLNETFRVNPGGLSGRVVGGEVERERDGRGGGEEKRSRERMIYKEGDE